MPLCNFPRRAVPREGGALYVVTQLVNSDGVEPRHLMSRRGGEKQTQDPACGSRGPLSSLCGPHQALALPELQFLHLKVGVLEWGSLEGPGPELGTPGRGPRTFSLKLNFIIQFSLPEIFLAES